MLTQRAFLLGIVAFCFYLIAVVNTLAGFYYVLVWLALGLMAASLGIALLSLTGLKCTLQIKRARGSSSLTDEEKGARSPVIEVNLVNRGTLNKVGNVLELRFSQDCGDGESKSEEKPKFLQRLLFWKRRNDDIKLKFLVEALPKGTSLTHPLFLRLPRGCYRLQSSRLIGTDVLGLFRASKRFAANLENEEFLVGPPILRSASESQFTATASTQMGNTRVRQVGGDEFRGVRAYAPGDDWRQIHWLSTARTGELAVREFERAGQPSVMVLWDGAAGSDWGLKPFSTEEIGLTFCASLLNTFIKERIPVVLGCLGQTSELVYGDPHESMSDELSEFVSVLSRAQAKREVTLKEAWHDISHEPLAAHGQIFIVSSSLRSDLVERVTTWKNEGHELTVVLLDGADFGSVTGDRRFAKKAPMQNDKFQLTSVTSSHYDKLAAEIRSADVTVHIVRLGAENAQKNSVQTQYDSQEYSLYEALETEFIRLLRT